MGRGGSSRRSEEDDDGDDNGDDDNDNDNVSSRSKSKGQPEQEGEGGKGDPVAVGMGWTGGVGNNARSLPGRVLLDGCCLLLRVCSWVGFLVVGVLEAKIVWTPLGNEL